MFPAKDSRKLTGLIIGLLALLGLVVLAIVGVAFFHVAESLFSQFGGMVTTITGVHQAAQATADRSPNYPNATSAGYRVPSTELQPAAAAQPARDPGSLMARLWRPQVAAYGAVLALGVVLMAWPALPM